MSGLQLFWTSILQSPGAYHTSEVPFWLGTLDSFNRFRTTRASTDAGRAFSHAMTRSLVAFARTSDPNGAVRD